MLGAAAGIEAIVCIKSIETGVSFILAINLTHPDPECDWIILPIKLLNIL